MKPTFSVIIRTKNERRYLPEVLRRVFAQKIDGSLEVIIVDSGSTDGTLSVLKKFPVRLIEIPSAEFSYPRASNIGAAAAEGEYLVYLSGHSLPADEEMLRKSIVCWRKLERENASSLAGVYGPVMALPGKGSSRTEKLIFSARRARKARAHLVEKAKMGILGCTNAIIRREIWRKTPFDEAYGLGGEDGAWARERLREGWGIGFCPALAVYHSHGLGPINLWRQWRHWKEIAAAREFDREKMSYRRACPWRPRN
ncbi:MAG TPA: glycosyltransferase family 2 protein [Candidatus Moranbacteria bacterium]|nr:glycosyltransferase family 2 protein [Candidatus Moranbacteria bacterium]